MQRQNHHRHGERGGRDAARQVAVKGKAGVDVINYAEGIRGYKNMVRAGDWCALSMHRVVSIDLEYWHSVSQGVTQLLG